MGWKLAGYKASFPKAAGYSAIALKTDGYTAIALKTAGYSVADLKSAGFANSELLSLGDLTSAPLQNEFFEPLPTPYSVWPKPDRKRRVQRPAALCYKVICTSSIGSATHSPQSD